MLTLVLLNKLRCHAYFQFSANQITWSSLLIQIHILNGKHCRSRSVGFFRSQLICIYTVCKDRVYLGSAGQGLNFFMLTTKPLITRFSRKDRLFGSLTGEQFLCLHAFTMKCFCCHQVGIVWTFSQVYFRFHPQIHLAKKTFFCVKCEDPAQYEFLRRIITAIAVCQSVPDNGEYSDKIA